MNWMRCLSISLVCAVSFLLTGCGGSELDKTKLELQTRQKQISELEARSSKQTEELRKQTEINDQLSQQMQDLISNVKSLESRLSAKSESKPAADAKCDEQSRVELLGAKAMAEFRAEQLNKRLENFNKEIEAKDKELEEGNQRTEQKEADLAEMKQRQEGLQAQNDGKTKELQSQLADLNRELAARGEAADRLKKELDEKSELLGALRNAVQDATKLKKATESELAKTRASEAELKNKLEETTNQLAKQNEEIGSFGAQAQSYTQELNRQKELARKMGVETEQLKKETTNLKAQVADLAQRLKSTQAAASSQPEEGPSALDQILQTPRTENKDSGSMSNLY